MCCVSCHALYSIVNSRYPTISQDQTNGCEALYINVPLPCAEYCRVVWIFEVSVHLLFVLFIFFLINGGMPLLYDTVAGS